MPLPASCCLLLAGCLAPGARCLHLRDLLAHQSAMDSRLLYDFSGKILKTLVSVLTTSAYRVSMKACSMSQATCMAFISGMADPFTCSICCSMPEMKVFSATALKGLPVSKLSGLPESMAAIVRMISAWHLSSSASPCQKSSSCFQRPAQVSYKRLTASSARAISSRVSRVRSSAGDVMASSSAQKKVLVSSLFFGWFPPFLYPFFACPPYKVLDKKKGLTVFRTR